MSTVTDPVIPQTGIPLKTVTVDNTPKHRVDDPTDAQTIVKTLWEANKVRHQEQAAWAGQINGNPPYNPSLMRKAGRAGDANFNTLEAKALVSMAMVPYYDLMAGGNRYVETALDIGDEWQATYMNSAVAEEWDDALRRWRGFHNVMVRMLRDFIVFGKGYLIPCKNGSWRFQVIAQHRVLVPDATPIDMEEAEAVVFLQDPTATYLMDKIRDRKAATTMGWDVEETRDAIRCAVPRDPATDSDAHAVQQQIRDADLYVSARNATVQCATLLIREFDGRWSELMVRRDQLSAITDRNPNARPARFMYKAFSKYQSLLDCLLPFFFEPADADWPGASGLGRDIFVPCQLTDRTWCSKVDSMILRNSIILQPRTETDRSKLNALQLGKITILPAGVEAKDSTILGDITSTIEVGRELSVLIEKNTGIYRPVLEKGGGNPDTLGEFQTKFAQATVLSSSAITRFYSQMDRAYEVMFKRLVEAGSKGKWDTDNEDQDDWENEARRFVARCEDRGVPRQLLKRPKYVRAFRAIGQGSAAMRQQITATFMNPQVFAQYPPDGQQNILEDFTRTLGGHTAVNRYLPPTSRMDLPNSHQWEAMMENASMKIGAPVTWTPRQNNIVHAQMHLVAATQAITSLQQGANPQEVLVYVDALGAHIAEHLQREMPKASSQAAVKALEQRWKQLASIADKLRGQIKASADEQQALAEKAQQTISDADIKRLDVQLKNEVSREKAAATLALKKERQDAEIALKREAMGADMQMSDASTAADITRKTAKTQAEMDAMMAKAAAKPENNGGE